MSKFKHSLLAGAIMLAVSAPAAAQFTGAFFFGDSLSDEGSFKPVLPPGTGLFTTNPGPLWPSLVANVYGFTATPANQGGNDYAYGGARVTRAARLSADAADRRGCSDLDAGLAVSCQGRTGSARAVLDPGRRERHLHSARCLRGRDRSAQAQLQANIVAHGHAVRAAGRAAQCRRRAVHPRLERSRHRQDARRRRLRFRTADHAGRAALQQHAAGGTQCRESQCDPVEYVRALERDRGESRRVWFHQRHGARVRHDAVASVHAGEPGDAERRADLCLCRRGAPDDGNGGDRRPIHRVGARRAAAGRGAGRNAARRRAGELARAGRPDGLRDQRVAPDQQDRGLGRVRLRESRLFERLHGRQRQSQHGLDRRRHAALQAACSSACSSATRRTRETSARPITSSTTTWGRCISATARTTGTSARRWAPATSTTRTSHARSSSARRRAPKRARPTATRRSPACSADTGSGTTTTGCTARGRNSPTTT